MSHDAKLEARMRRIGLRRSNPLLKIDQPLKSDQISRSSSSKGHHAVRIRHPKLPKKARAVQEDCSQFRSNSPCEGKPSLRASTADSIEMNGQGGRSEPVLKSCPQFHVADT